MFCGSAESVRRLLAPGEVTALERLEERQREVRRGALIQRENDPVGELYVLRRGWVLSYAMLIDGSRQILRIHFPGEFIGTTSAVYKKAPNTLLALTDLTVCPFDKRSLKALLEDHPRLAGLMYLISQAERVSLTDRLASLGRTSARSRVGALLLDMLDRLRLIDAEVGDSFPLRLTQEEIGDATGLTAVHVNRMMRALVEAGLIERANGAIRILDETTLARESNYVNRYTGLDLSWLPRRRAKRAFALTEPDVSNAAWRLLIRSKPIRTGCRATLRPPWRRSPAKMAGRWSATR